MFKPIPEFKSFQPILVSRLDDLCDKSEIKRKHTDLLKVGEEERKSHTPNCNIYNRRVVISLGDNRIKCIILSEN